MSVWPYFEEGLLMEYSSCLSIRCPNWIDIDLENNRVTVDGRGTRHRRAQGMYMLLFEYFWFYQEV